MQACSDLCSDPATGATVCVTESQSRNTKASACGHVCVCVCQCCGTHTHTDSSNEMLTFKDLKAFKGEETVSSNCSNDIKYHVQIQGAIFN